MSWSKRHFLLAGLGLAGCTLRPLYGPQTGNRRGMFAFDVPQTEAGFILLRSLEDRFGAPDHPDYKLQINLNFSSQAVFDGRNDVMARADWKLYRGTQMIHQSRAHGLRPRYTEPNFGAEVTSKQGAMEATIAQLTARIEAQVWATL